MSDRYGGFLRDVSRLLPARAPAYLQPAPARFIVLSDLHGSNRLDLVHAVTNTERNAGRDLSAVLILGDLVNFGFPIELRLKRFRASLARLAIPVLVILGNHDKHRPKDSSLARHLAKIPNVTLMQTGNGYQFPTFGPISVGGFDDPRYFGDNNVGNAKKQKPAREAFLKAARARGGVPDIVMVHEPYAAGAPPALWLNGHMHAPKLDPARRRVQVGMFTDGSFYYNRKVHRRAPSNFVLLAARESPESASVASVTFQWKRGVPYLSDIDGAEIPVSK